MVEIIRADIPHIPAIQEVAKKTWPVTFGNILSKTQISYMLEMMYSTPSLRDQMREKKHVFILALDETKVVGFASYETNHQRSDKTKIHKIYILPDMQGKGVGKALIQHIGKEALGVNNPTLVLNVNRHNKAALGFYHRAGFITTAEENIPIGQGYLMEDFVLEFKI